ncbi:hypothetical protein JIN85_15210 [Luteolibacter pohnpeiensis]|uniref:Uncharacterized protein n=1 Tax=Luteolibacter pohnpeiensis TaxID=454153 RepID=A0A934S6W9_9BACT|nr:hypothetical protein [Luteolibacter pohnpeiensis]MBK1883766.1 hypothetical protein [Luteolibacter pohnpeiensis]
MNSKKMHLPLAVVVFFCLASIGFSEEVVKWPNLRKLDEVAEKCEALSEIKDIKALRNIATTAKLASEAVEKDKIPANAKDPHKIKTLQSDLKSLTDLLDHPATQDGEEVMDLLAGIHPIVEQLMEAAGMPHVHEAKPQQNHGDANKIISR